MPLTHEVSLERTYPKSHVNVQTWSLRSDAMHVRKVCHVQNGKLRFLNNAVKSRVATSEGSTLSTRRPLTVRKFFGAVPEAAVDGRRDFAFDYRIGYAPRSRVEYRRGSRRREHGDARGDARGCESREANRLARLADLENIRAIPEAFIILL